MYVSVNLVAVPSVWIRDTAHLRVLKCLSARPHRTYPFVFENEDFFPLWFGLSSTRVRWKRSAKTHLFKSLSRAEIFEHTVCWTCVDGGKTNTSKCWIQSTPRTRWDEMRMLQSKKVTLSATTSFSFGREKTVQKRNVRRKAEKRISTFRQRRIRVNGD